MMSEKLWDSLVKVALLFDVRFSTLTLTNFYITFTYVIYSRLNSARQDANAKAADKHMHSLPVNDPIWFLIAKQRRSAYELFMHAFPQCKSSLRLLIHTHEFYKVRSPQQTDIPEYPDHNRTDASWHRASPSTYPKYDIFRYYTLKNGTTVDLESSYRCPNIKVIDSQGYAKFCKFDPTISWEDVTLSPSFVTLIFLGGATSLYRLYIALGYPLADDGITPLWSPYDTAIAIIVETRVVRDCSGILHWLIDWNPITKKGIFNSGFSGPPVISSFEQPENETAELRVKKCYLIAIATQDSTLWPVIGRWLRNMGRPEVRVNSSIDIEWELNVLPRMLDPGHVWMASCETTSSVKLEELGIRGITFETVLSDKAAAQFISYVREIDSHFETKPTLWAFNEKGFPKVHAHLPNPENYCIAISTEQRETILAQMKQQEEENKRAQTRSAQDMPKNQYGAVRGPSHQFGEKPPKTPLFPNYTEYAQPTPNDKYDGAPSGWGPDAKKQTSLFPEQRAKTTNDVPIRSSTSYTHKSVEWLKYYNKLGTSAATLYTGDLHISQAFAQSVGMAVRKDKERISVSGHREACAIVLGATPGGHAILGEAACVKFFEGQVRRAEIHGAEASRAIPSTPDMTKLQLQQNLNIFYKNCDNKGIQTIPTQSMGNTIEERRQFHMDRTNGTLRARNRANGFQRDVNKADPKTHLAPVVSGDKTFELFSQNLDKKTSVTWEYNEIVGGVPVKRLKEIVTHGAIHFGCLMQYMGRTSGITCIPKVWKDAKNVTIGGVFMKCSLTNAKTCLHSTTQIWGGTTAYVFVGVAGFSSEDAPDCLRFNKWHASMEHIVDAFMVLGHDGPREANTNLTNGTPVRLPTNWSEVLGYVFGSLLSMTEGNVHSNIRSPGLGHALTTGTFQANGGKLCLYGAPGLTMSGEWIIVSTQMPHAVQPAPKPHQEFHMIIDELDLWWDPVVGLKLDDKIVANTHMRHVAPVLGQRSDHTETTASLRLPQHDKKRTWGIPMSQFIKCDRAPAEYRILAETFKVEETTPGRYHISVRDSEGVSTTPHEIEELTLMAQQTLPIERSDEDVTDENGIFVLPDVLAQAMQPAIQRLEAMVKQMEKYCILQNELEGEYIRNPSFELTCAPGDVVYGPSWGEIRPDIIYDRLVKEYENRVPPDAEQPLMPREQAFRELRASPAISAGLLHDQVRPLFLFEDDRILQELNTAKAAMPPGILAASIGHEWINLRLTLVGLKKLLPADSEKIAENDHILSLMDQAESHPACFIGMRTYSLIQAMSDVTRKAIRDTGADELAEKLRDPGTLTGYDILKIAKERGFTVFMSGIELQVIARLVDPSREFSVPNEEFVDSFEDPDELLRQYPIRGVGLMCTNSTQSPFSKEPTHTYADARFPGLTYLAGKFNLSFSRPGELADVLAVHLEPFLNFLVSDINLGAAEASASMTTHMRVANSNLYKNLEILNERVAAGLYLALNARRLDISVDAIAPLHEQWSKPWLLGANDERGRLSGSMHLHDVINRLITNPEKPKLPSIEDFRRSLRGEELDDNVPEDTTTSLPIF